MNHRNHIALIALLVAVLAGGALGFTSSHVSRGSAAAATFPSPIPSALHAEAVDGEADPSELIARRIVVTGDVDGGYYRSCVKNEVGPTMPVRRM